MGQQFSDPDGMAIRPCLAQLAAFGWERVQSRVHQSVGRGLFHSQQHQSGKQLNGATPTRDGWGAAREKVVMEG